MTINYKFLTILFLAFAFSNCSKPDKDFSLLEPEFERCYISKEIINGELWKEILYKDDGSFNIDRVLYYQNNVVREDWTETFTYDGDKISGKSDFYNTWKYEYNDQGDLSRLILCQNNNNSCCTSNYEYNYDVNNLPVKITTSCNDGDSYTETFDYTNLDTRSYYYIYQDNFGTTLNSYQKFVESYINPNGSLNPDAIDLYQDRVVEDYKNSQFIEYLINPADVKGRYPTRVTRETYSLPGFQLTGQNVYTYEYVGCE